MNFVREWYLEARRVRAGRRQLEALSDHLRRDVGMLHGEPGMSAGGRHAAPPASAAHSAVVLHLRMGGPDTPQATRNLRLERREGRIDTHAA